MTSRQFKRAVTDAVQRIIAEIRHGFLDIVEHLMAPAKPFVPPLFVFCKMVRFPGLDRLCRHLTGDHPADHTADDPSPRHWVDLVRSVADKHDITPHHLRACLFPRYTSP